MIFNKDFEKEYCMKCGNENPQDREVCDCGRRDFVFFGDSINYSEQEGIICNCGSKEFKMIFHMNMNPIFSEASPTSIPK